MWMYIKGDDTFGPVSEGVLRELAQTGDISLETEVKEEGDSVYKKVQNTELKTLFPKPRPKPRPKPEVKLINCAACGKQVSNQASACPHCGQPIEGDPAISVEWSDYICKACGFVGQPKKTSNCSVIVTLILLLFFFIPGIIYIAWCLASKRNVCPECGSKDVIPGDSPTGRELVAKG